MGTPADKLNKLLDTKSDLKAALTEKGQAPGNVFAEYPDMVRAIETGKDVSGVTAGAGDVRQGKVIVDSQGNPIEGNQPTRSAADLTANGATVSVPAGIYDSPVSKPVQTIEQAEPSVSVDADGLITAEVAQGEGYVTAGKKTATKQLTVQPAKTVTPSTTDQTAVASGVYTTGAVMVKGDANLKAENIADGVSIFDVVGTHKGGTDLCVAYTSTSESGTSTRTFGLARTVVFERGMTWKDYVNSPYNVFHRASSTEPHFVIANGNVSFKNASLSDYVITTSPFGGAFVGEDDKIIENYIYGTADTD